MGQNPLAITLVNYRNHRGEVSTRRIEPLQMWFGSTQWHPNRQWLLKAFDHDKQEWRDFAMTQIHFLV